MENPGGMGTLLLIFIAQKNIIQTISFLMDADFKQLEDWRRCT